MGRTTLLVASVATVLLTQVPAGAMAPAQVLAPADHGSSAAAVPGAGVRYVDPVFADVDITRGIRYGQAVNNRGDLQQLTLDLYKPAVDSSDDRPAVVFAHGGGFAKGVRETPNLGPYLLGLAQRGYVVMSIDYRIRPPGSPNSERAGQIFEDWAVGKQSAVIRDAQHDMQAAVRWTRARATDLGVDPEAIIVSGNSAGAVTAWSTGINVEDPGQSGNPEQSSKVAAVVSMWGAMSPHEMEAGAPPLIDVHGLNDVAVPAPAASAACARMITLGNRCEQYLLPTGEHPAWDYLDHIFPEVTGFLCRTVLSSCSALPPSSPIRIGPHEPGETTQGADSAI